MNPPAVRRRAAGPAVSALSLALTFIMAICASAASQDGIPLTDADLLPEETVVRGDGAAMPLSALPGDPDSIVDELPSDPQIESRVVIVEPSPVYRLYNPDYDRYREDNVFLPGSNRWDLYQYRPDRRPPPPHRWRRPHRPRGEPFLRPRPDHPRLNPARPRR